MKSFYKFLWVPAAFMLLQSCLVTKEYEQPENVVQQEYYRTDSIPTDSLSMAHVSWQTLFTDSLLQNYINTALTNNIDIRVALQQIQAAQAYVKQGKAAFLPTLSAGANYNGSFYSKNGQQAALAQTGKDYLNLYNMSLNLSWEADIWGKITSQKRAFTASYLQTVAAHKAVTTSLIAGVATTYYQLLAIDKQIAVTKRTIKTRKKSLETTKALKKAGSASVTSAAVAQTKAQYLAAQAILIDLDKQARLLENSLCLLMGEPPHDIARTSLKSQDINTALKVGVPMQLLQNRPDVIVAEMNYRQAFELTNVARASFYPSLTIGASGGIESTQLEDWFDVNSLFANFLGGLTAPIFNGRQIRTQFEVAKVQQKQAKLKLKGTLLTASKEVSDALYAYQAATDKIVIKKQELDLLQQAVEDSQALMINGYANFSYLEVLRAQESALNSSLEVINARVAQLTSIVNLYEALGGGWR